MPQKELEHEVVCCFAALVVKGVLRITEVPALYRERVGDECWVLTAIGLPEPRLVGSLVLQFPEHKCSLHLTHNQHRAYYETIEVWEGNLKSCSNEDTANAVEFGWVSHEQRALAIATDNVWELQWYPNTPVGFKRLFACDLPLLLQAARNNSKLK